MSEQFEDYQFTLTHEWLRKEGEGFTIGITEHAQQLLGDLVFVELPEVGAEITAGDELGVVESVKAASDFYSPIQGVVLAVNQALSEDPGLVNQDPYGAGWLVKLKVTGDPHTDSLLSYPEYETAVLEGQ